MTPPYLEHFPADTLKHYVQAAWRQFLECLLDVLLGVDDDVIAAQILLRSFNLVPPVRSPTYLQHGSFLLRRAGPNHHGRTM